MATRAMRLNRTIQDGHIRLADQDETVSLEAVFRLRATR